VARRIDRDALITMLHLTIFGIGAPIPEPRRRIVRKRGRMVR
jgi:hypothetical protein